MAVELVSRLVGSRILHLELPAHRWGVSDQNIGAKQATEYGQGTSGFSESVV
jgi:hypothetical protein